MTTTATTIHGPVDPIVAQLVLSKLGAGKITADEAADLLDKIGTMAAQASLIDDLAEYIDESHDEELPVSGDDFELYLDCIYAGS